MKKIVAIWIGLNIVLMGKYLFDSHTINCEPCLPEVVCPPCETDFMSNIWWILLGLNSLILILTVIAFKKKLK